MAKKPERTENKRRWKRFALRDGALALAVKPSFLRLGKPVHVKLGPIKDIGMKGLAVQYVEKKNLLNNVKELSIMIPGEGIKVERIPFETVMDFEVGQLSGSKRIRTLCVSFNQMNPMQKLQLERFIDEYAIDLTP
ncbi:MAG: hypothetical protein ACOZBW_04115 [Thermodesulfobacteriota bacterium]